MILDGSNVTLTLEGQAGVLARLELLDLVYAGIAGGHEAWVHFVVEDRIDPENPAASRYRREAVIRCDQLIATRID